ncbi:MAG: AbrB/MazE/SpoVT family DNA-binding domain-containing protein [Nitrososphaeria archaeon]
MKKNLYLGRRKVSKIGKSLTITIPKIYIDSVNLKKGDLVAQYLTEDGSLLIKKVEVKSNENVKGDQNGK